MQRLAQKCDEVGSYRAIGEFLLRIALSRRGRGDLQRSKCRANIRPRRDAHAIEIGPGEMHMAIEIAPGKTHMAIEIAKSSQVDQFDLNK